MGYIKQITIQGFKSYKEQMQIEPFSPNCNVVVGRNGSGKSNFFAAVRFVLGDDYHNLGREERQALLHEGSGSAVMSAYVEVCFDNTEDRFQTGKPEFYLRRTIGAKKDEYSVNRKNATKAEVTQILESAGFSRSNPYYIVPQGRVTALTNMKDSERLRLLKEISGSNVYEERRTNSLKLLVDTESKCTHIDDIVANINDRLEELEAEKDELEAWSRNERERKALVYTLNTREEAVLESQIEGIDQDEEQNRERKEHNEATFLQNEADMAQIDTDINKQRGDLDILREDRSQSERERKAATLEKAKVELELKTLQDNQSAAQQTKASRDAQIKALQRQIRTRETQLQRLRPAYKAKKEEEDTVRSQLLEAESQRKRLEEKQGRTAYHSNKHHRDAELRTKIDDSNELLSRKKAVLMQNEEESAQLEEDISRFEREVAQLRSTIDGKDDVGVNLATLLEQAKDVQKTLHDEQTNLFREDNRLSSRLTSTQAELRKAESTFSRLLDHGTSRGLESIRHFLKESDLEGVHGTIADLLEVDDTYRSVTEAAAEGALFNVVVDNDDVASRLMDKLSKKKGGRLTFIPLNRIQEHDAPLAEKPGLVKPLLPQLRYDTRYEKAFRFVFGRVVVCPDLTICKETAKQYNVQAYTLDGDNASRKGQYRGGYHDPSKSKIKAYQTLARLRGQYDELQQQRSNIAAELDQKRQQLTAATSERRRREHERSQGDNNYAPMRDEMRTKQRSLRDAQDGLATKQATVTKLRSEINQLSAQQNDWEAEMASEFKKALSSDEEQMLSTLRSTVNDLQRQLARITEERTTLETQKVEAEFDLDENLQTELDSLQAQQGGSSGSMSQSALLRESERTLNTIDQNIAALDVQIQEIDAQIENISTQLSELEKSRSEKETANRQLAKMMDKQERAMANKDTDRSRLTKRLTEVKQAIRTLGTLPEDAHRRYTRWNDTKINDELRKTNKALHNFKHVNKKAFEQYENWTKQRRALADRRADLDTSRESIENLIDVLDQRKDEAIARTFKQVGKAFEEVFQQLVPIGQGRLIINRKSDRDVRGDVSDDDIEEEETQGKKSKVEEYTGVSIAVSFNSKHDEQQKISQLSGGQKSLCALALIFAIQKCDPAPFYLFDEIDANLDAQYRTAVAQMLKRLSGQGGKTQDGGGQFICTTFRPEMVHVADRCYGVSYTNKTSSIDVVERSAALNFVDGMQKT